MKNIKNFMFVVLASAALFACKNEDQNTKEDAPLETKTDSMSTTVSVENLKTESFGIEGMTCEMGCAKAIESKLAGLDGVTDAKVDFENKTATVSFDETKQNKSLLVKTVEAVAGGDTYKVTEIEEEDAI